MSLIKISRSLHVSWHYVIQLRKRLRTLVCNGSIAIYPLCIGAERELTIIVAGMKVTFDAIRALLESLRKVCPRVRVMYTSSQTVYTGDLVQPVNESMRATPQSSYGCAKVMCEYLLNDILAEISSTAFILRLPTIPVRPGKPTAAVTSFLSGMILREPMQGLIPCVIPLKDRNFSH